MLPNSDIWGLPETWINAKIWVGTNAENPDIKATYPKIANFGGADTNHIGSIGRAVNNNVFEFTQIDNSIVPCGQSLDYSPYAVIKMFKNTRDADDNKIPYQIVTRSTPANWFFYYISGFETSSLWTINYHGVVNRSNPLQVIYPDAQIGDASQSRENPNMLLSPIVYYGIRSMFGIIYVVVDDDTPLGGNMYTLSTWKNSYSDKPIREVYLQIFGYHSTVDDTIEIRTDNTMTSSTALSAAVYDDISGVASYSIWSYDRKPYVHVVNACTDNRYDTDSTFNAVGWRDDWTGSTVKSDIDDRWAVWQSIPYNEHNYELIMKMCACFGIPFSDTLISSYKTDFNDSNVCLPVIDNDGIATGNYTRGQDNLTNPFASLDSVRDKDYNPSAPQDPNTYSNTTGFNSISGGASMTKRYVLDKTNVDLLADDLWTISSELAQVQGSQDYDHFEAKVIDNFLVTSPIDSIVSLKRYPFDVPHTFSSTKELVKLGKNTATAQGYATYNVFNTVQFAGVNITKRFGGCFLDYEPYTQYELYVPFCGTTNLQAADIVGHILNVRLQIDLLTGTCTAYIMADSLCIETLTGNCGCDLQITGTDTTYMNSAIVNSITNARHAKTQKEVADLSTISPSGLFSAVTNPWKAAGEKTTAETNMYQADYNLQHIQTPLHSMGTASALTGWYQEFNARLMIYYPMGDAIISTVPPKLADLTNYGHITGFATVQNKTLSNFTGLTVCSDVDLSGISQATATEKQMIYNALTGGVYI